MTGTGRAVNQHSDTPAPATINGVDVVMAQSMQGDESTTVTSAMVVSDGSAASTCDVCITVVTAPMTPAADAEADDSMLGECVICLGDLGDDGAPTTTLICNHKFHQSCVNEWLNKDGRCPTCRRQIRAVAPPPSLARNGPTQATMHSMAMLMLESRRLMMLATMEAALAVSTKIQP